MSEIEIRILYDKKKSLNPIRIKFPNFCYTGEFMRGEIGDEIEDLNNGRLEHRLVGNNCLLREKINAKYLIRSECQDYNFK